MKVTELLFLFPNVSTFGNAKDTHFFNSKEI